MTKFQKAKMRIEMLEAAYEAIIDTAMREARYNESEYLDADCNDEQGWKDSEYLKRHLNTQGQELLRLAQDLAERIEELM